MLNQDHGSGDLGRQIRNHQDLDEDHGLQTKYNSEFDATILLDKLDHMQNPDPHWAFFIPSSHDCHRNLHLCHRTLHLEVLLPIQGTTDSNSISTSYAALGHHAPTSSCSNGRSHTHPEARSKQSGLVEQHSDPDQHHLHLRKTKRTFHGRTSKKGDILETIYIYMLML
jgi:hypothetical protein